MAFLATGPPEEVSDHVSESHLAAHCPPFWIPFPLVGQSPASPPAHSSLLASEGHYLHPEPQHHPLCEGHKQERLLGLVPVNPVSSAGRSRASAAEVVASQSFWRQVRVKRRGGTKNLAAFWPSNGDQVRGLVLAPWLGWG